MSIFRKIDKVLGAFGNIRALERTHVDTFTENLINNVPGEKIAESKDGQLYAEFQELAGFNFMESTILSRENIKTFKGAKLSFIGEDDELILDSDITEIESDYSNVSNRWMTKVSYVVSKEDIKFITEKKSNTIVFEYKRKAIKLYGIK